MGNPQSADSGRKPAQSGQTTTREHQAEDPLPEPTHYTKEPADVGPQDILDEDEG